MNQLANPSLFMCRPASLPFLSPSSPVTLLSCLQSLEQLLLRYAPACEPPVLMQCLQSLVELGRGPLAPTPNPLPAIRPPSTPQHSTSSPAVFGAASKAIATPGASHFQSTALDKSNIGGLATSKDSSSGKSGEADGRDSGTGLLLGVDAQSQQVAALLLRVLMERARFHSFLKAIPEASLLRLLGCLAKVGIAWDENMISCLPRWSAWFAYAVASSPGHPGSFAAAPAGPLSRLPVWWDVPPKSEQARACCVCKRLQRLGNVPPKSEYARACCVINQRQNTDANGHCGVSPSHADEELVVAKSRFCVSSCPCLPASFAAPALGYYQLFQLSTGLSSLIYWQCESFCISISTSRAGLRAVLRGNARPLASWNTF
eukprot:scaffold100258_cov17-Tisochrysis_lutea.AAC.1